MSKLFRKAPPLMRLYPTLPLAIIDAPADERHQGGRRPGRPQFIIMHATAGTNSLKWLTTDPSSDVSCHRLIAKNGSIYKLVPDEKIAHTQGFAKMGPFSPSGPLGLNEVALAIELENLSTGADVYPSVQVLAAAYQVHEWHGAYGLLPVLGHGDVDERKDDPKGFPWNEFYGYLLRLYRTS